MIFRICISCWVQWLEGIESGGLAEAKSLLGGRFVQRGAVYVFEGGHRVKNVFLLH